MGKLKINGDFTFSGGTINLNEILAQIVNGNLETKLDTGYKTTTQGAMSLSNGLTIRWGFVSNVSGDAGKPTLVVFPKPFSVGCVGTMLSWSRTFPYVETSKTQLYLATASGGAGSSCRWIAIGY